MKKIKKIKKVKNVPGQRRMPRLFFCYEEPDLIRFLEANIRTYGDTFGLKVRELPFEHNSHSLGIFFSRIERYGKNSEKYEYEATLNQQFGLIVFKEVQRKAAHQLKEMRS